MIVKANGKEIQTATEKIARFVSRSRHTKYAYALYLRAEGDALFLGGVFDAGTITAKIPALVIEAGDAAVTASKFLALVKKRKGEIEIVSEGQFVAVDGNAINRLYVPIPSLEHKPLDGQSITVLAAEFAVAVKAVAPMASKDHRINKALLGVLLEFCDNHLNLVASDGYKLGCKRLEMETSEQIEAKFILDDNMIEKLATTVRENGRVQIVIAGNEVSITSGNVIVNANTIDANYPNYRLVVPSEYTTRALVNVDELLEACVAMDAIDDYWKALELSFSGKGLSATPMASEWHGATKQIHAVVSGLDRSIRVNPRYLREILSLLNVPGAFIELSRGDGPIVIRPAGRVDHYYLLMPMRK